MSFREFRGSKLFFAWVELTFSGALDGSIFGDSDARRLLYFLSPPKPGLSHISSLPTSWKYFCAVLLSLTKLTGLRRASFLLLRRWAML